MQYLLVLNTVTILVEIVSGSVYRPMALLTYGWHRVTLWPRS